MKGTIEPIPEVPIRYRLIEAEDMAFVIDSWMKSYRNRLYGQGVSHRTYQQGQLALIKYLSRTCMVLVACDAKQPAYIVGWACARVNKVGDFHLHYIYVKDDYRRHGIARAILTHLGYRDGSPILMSHYNHNARDIAMTHDVLTYNPYLTTLGAADYV